MKFKLTATDPGYGTYFENTEIEINTIEELLEFARKCGRELVIDPDEPSIEIYNGYRE